MAPRPKPRATAPHAAATAAIVLATLALSTAPSTSFAQRAAADQNLFEGAVDWINTAKPIDSRDLRGKIILLDFWTYCCINCHHVIPDLERLEQKFRNEVVVIGVHTPKFEAERESANIRQKVREYRVKHPVANDANMVLWRRFGVEAWPTLAIIDANGRFLGSVGGESPFKNCDEFVGKLITQHRGKKELNETPFVVYSESDRPSDGPLLYPGKVLADATGDRLFITDTGHNRIVVTDLNGKLRDVIGDGEQGLRDGDFATARFNRPQGTRLVGETLYVADTENHALRAVDLKAKKVATIAGNGEQSERRTGGGPAKRESLSSPWDVIQLPGSNDLVIAMAGVHQLWLYDPDDQTIRVWAGSGREDIIDGSYEDAAFAQPSGLASDSKFIYVADSEVSGIRAVSADGKAKKDVQTVVGMGLFEFADIDGQADNVRLQHCLGVAKDGDGPLYIADTYNNKIKTCDVPTRTVKSLVGTREPGSSDAAPSFYQPGGLSVAGNSLYVADSNNNAIRVIDIGDHETRTLSLEGVTPPSPPRRKPTFRDPVATTVDPVQVAPGKKLEIVLKVALPGFKLAPETPLLYLVEAPNDSSALAASVSPTGTRVVPDGAEIRVPVELSREPKAGDKLDLRLSSSIFACSETSGFCTLKNFTWDVPLTFAEGGSTTVEVTTPAGDAAN